MAGDGAAGQRGSQMPSGTEYQLSAPLPLLTASSVQSVEVTWSQCLPLRERGASSPCAYGWPHHWSSRRLMSQLRSCQITYRTCRVLAFVRSHAPGPSPETGRRWRHECQGCRGCSRGRGRAGVRRPQPSESGVDAALPATRPLVVDLLVPVRCCPGQAASAGRIGIREGGRAARYAAGGPGSAKATGTGPPPVAPDWPPAWSYAWRQRRTWSAYQQACL